MSVENVNDDTPVLDRSNDSGIDQPTITNEVRPLCFCFIKKLITFQYRTNWIPAKMKSTAIKSARVGDAHMDILAINLAMGLEKYPRVDDLLNMTVRQFARNVSSIFESTEKMKLAKFKTFDECSSKFFQLCSTIILICSFM